MKSIQKDPSSFLKTIKINNNNDISVGEINFKRNVYYVIVNMLVKLVNYVKMHKRK